MARTLDFRLLGASALLLTGCYSDTTEPSLGLEDAAVAVSQDDAAVVSDAGPASGPDGAAEDCEAVTDPLQQILCDLTGGDPAALGGLEDLIGGFLGGGTDDGAGDFGGFDGQPTEEECRDPSDAITRFLCGRMNRRDAGSPAVEDAAVAPEQPEQPGEQDASVNDPSDAAVDVDAALPFPDAGADQDAGPPLTEGDASTDGGVDQPALELLDATVAL